MIAAIYARKSTEQTGVADDQKSVTRQIDHARAYAVRKGWTIADAHVYVDDGISGAEFENRPGFVQLLKALKPAAFTILIVSELSRLGREQLETGYALKRLSVAGVRVFTYLDDREVQVDTATNKFMLSAGSFGAELEREKARQRITDALLRKARAGHCCGGRTFGYDNVEILDATGKRSHVERHINPAEAAIVRRIFALSAAGVGYTRIAKQLNGEHAPAPRPKAGRLAGWAPSSVKEVLDRRLYLGEVVWNRTQKCNTWGQQHQQARPETEWIRTEAPHLRIITERDWQAAHGRLAGMRARLQGHGFALGRRRPRDIESEPTCCPASRAARSAAAASASSAAVTAAPGRTSTAASPITSAARRSAGTTSRSRSIASTTRSARNREAAAARTGADHGDRRWRAGRTGAGADRAVTGQQRTALQRGERELGNLAKAIAVGGQLDPLLAELRVRQARRDELIAAIAASRRRDAAAV